MFSFPFYVVVIAVLALYGLGVAPEEMPVWFPWAALAGVVVTLIVVLKSTGDYIKRRR